MSLFGEIVIPSSRILWDDDEDSEQTTEKTALVWTGNSKVPSKINNLLIVETTKLSQIAKTCLKNTTDFCSIEKAKLSIYKLLKDDYLICCEDTNSICVGELTETLIPWLSTAENIITLTSATLCTYYCQRRENELCVIRALSNGNTKLFAPKLETPNLITGISAGVLSYCKHIEKTSVVYICYLESREMDSHSAAPILGLLEKLHIGTAKPFKFTPKFHDPSNLYA